MIIVRYLFEIASYSLNKIDLHAHTHNIYSLLLSTLNYTKKKIVYRIETNICAIFMLMLLLFSKQTDYYYYYIFFLLSIFKIKFNENLQIIYLSNNHNKSAQNTNGLFLLIIRIQIIKRKFFFQTNKVHVHYQKSKKILCWWRHWNKNFRIDYHHNLIR